MRRPYLVRLMALLRTSARVRAWLRSRGLPFWVTIAVGAFLVMLVFVPILQVRRYTFSSEDQRAKQEDEYRRTVAQIVGGILVLAGGYFTYRNLRLTQDKQLTDRFAKAIDQLGSEKLELKLGGIYSLERIARESDERDHWTIMEVLTAYVREHVSYKTPTEELIEDLGPPEPEPKWPPTEIQAILTVIGRRRRTFRDGEDSRLDLSETNLFNADLVGANLAGVRLHNSNLAGAKLLRSNLQISDLAGANLNGAILVGANLSSAILTQAKLHRANLLQAVLVNANLVEADLSSARLADADLKGATLFDANLRRAYLRGANLVSVILGSADLATSVGLTQSQVDAANGDSSTKLPNDLHSPPHWYRDPFEEHQAAPTGPHTMASGPPGDPPASEAT